MLTEDNVIPDRIVPGSEGGTYRRSNIRGPHCPTCSCRQGQRLTAEIARQADPYGDDDLCKACGVHWLATHQCDEAQGYLYARPLPADQFEAWLTSPTSTAATLQPGR